MATSRTGKPKGVWGQVIALYELLNSPRFAILVIIALAVASILGLVIIDQIPFRGEMARMRYADQSDDPLVWFLIHIVPASPFRSLVYRTLLALLSLSLLACTIKRWQLHWRQALTAPRPTAEVFDSPNVVVWQTADAAADRRAATVLRRRGFTVRSAECAGGSCLAAKRFGISRLGPVLTHLGFLFLVVGGLWMASSGTSQMIWMRTGDWVQIPGTGARLHLDDFRIDTTPAGQIADYVSSVSLYQDTTLIRRTEIEVNKPLRYRGHSVYQTSYRQDPTQVQSVNVMIDVAQLGEVDHAAIGDDEPTGAATMAEDERPMHGRVQTRFAEPLTVQIPWGQRVPLDLTPYAAEIDTFLADFRIMAGGPGLASAEPHNPAVRLRFFAADSLVGSSWYFAFHPEMSVGSGPDLPLRFASYEPLMTTGLDIATHPGSGWVWAGIAIMTLGTLLSFLLRYERAWLHLRRLAGGWEITLLHQGSPRQAPEYARADWQRRVTPLAIEMLRHLEPEGGQPVRWPGMKES